MVTVELPITLQQKATAEYLASKNGYSLGEYLAKVTIALLPTTEVPQKKRSILEALKELPPLTGERPMTAEEDKAWLLKSIQEKHGGNH
jgi:hypothetical protein